MRLQPMPMGILFDNESGIEIALLNVTISFVLLKVIWMMESLMIAL